MLSPNVCLNSRSRILAIVPHYQCEQWLTRCLASLVRQTRPLDGIVVVDDGSHTPPISIVKQFPNVTLLASTENGGPYRLVQQVIEETDYDGYLFQDADDWSGRDRLEKLLAGAELTGAELVGCWELRMYASRPKVLVPVYYYPQDVNTAYREQPRYYLLHPSSLVSRSLVMRLGGFATGLRFGGDHEFLSRAVFAAKVRNVPEYCYFRFKRANSLSTSTTTGINSPARLKLRSEIVARARANFMAVAQGEKPDLEPLLKAEPPRLRRIIDGQLRLQRC